MTSYLTAIEQWLDKVLSGKRYQLGRESIGKCRSGIQSTRVYGNAKFFPVSDGRLQRSSFRLLYVHVTTCTSPYFEMGIRYKSAHHLGGGRTGGGRHHDGAHLPIFAELHGMTCLVAAPSRLAAPCSDGEACEFSIMTLKPSP